MLSKHPPTEKAMADCRSQSSPLPQHEGKINNAAPAPTSTKNTTNSKDNETEASGTNGDGSSTANASQPTMVAVSGSPKDIICGRGLHILSHHGNHNLHLIVDRFRQPYQIGTRNEKAAITKRIVGELKSTGARFLRRFNDNGDYKWAEVDDKTAYNKVSHALRLRKNDQQGQNFLKSLHGQQVDCQRSLTTLQSAARAETETQTGTSQAVVAVPSTSIPQNPMLHMSRLSSLSSASMHLPLAPPENQLQLATQPRLASQSDIGTHPAPIRMPLNASVSAAYRKAVIRGYLRREYQSHLPK